MGELFPTERSEEDHWGQEEAQHQSHNDDAGHDWTEPPPAHQQDDPARHANHCRQDEAHCWQGGTEALRHLKMAKICTADGSLLTVIVQVCGSGDQHKEEERSKAESHAEQLCVTRARVSGRFTVTLSSAFLRTASAVKRSIGTPFWASCGGDHMSSWRPRASRSDLAKKSQRTDHIWRIDDQRSRRRGRPSPRWWTAPWLTPFLRDESTKGPLSTSGSSFSSHTWIL